MPFFRLVVLSHFVLSHFLFAANGRSQDQTEPFSAKNAARIQLRPGSLQACQKMQKTDRGELLVMDKEFTLLRQADLIQIRSFEKPASSNYVLSPDQSHSCWLADTSELIIRNEQTGENKRIEAGKGLERAVFSPNSKLIAVTDSVSASTDQQGYASVSVISVESGELLKNLKVTPNRYGYLPPMFSPDGSVLAISDRNYQPLIYATEDWQLLHRLPKRMPQGLAFNADGNKLATGYVDGSLRVWDVSTGRIVGMVKTFDEIYSVAWSPNDELLATAGRSGVYLWAFPWSQAPYPTGPCSNRQQKLHFLGFSVSSPQISRLADQRCPSRGDAWLQRD